MKIKDTRDIIHYKHPRLILKLAVNISPVLLESAEGAIVWREWRGEVGGFLKSYSFSCMRSCNGHTGNYLIIMEHAQKETQGII